jgi:hypothetical protein
MSTHMSTQKSTQKESRIRDMVPCVLAFLIFVVPILVSLTILPVSGPVFALLGGVAAYLVILAICVLIWWVERVKQKPR